MKTANSIPDDELTESTNRVCAGLTDHGKPAKKDKFVAQAARRILDRAEW